MTPPPNQDNNNEEPENSDSSDDSQKPESVNGRFDRYLEKYGRYFVPWDPLIRKENLTARHLLLGLGGVYVTIVGLLLLKGILVEPLHAVLVIIVLALLGSNKQNK